MASGPFTYTRKLHHCVVRMAATATAEVVLAVAAADELELEPLLTCPQADNINSVAARATLFPNSLETFMATPLEIADTTERLTITLNQDRIATIHGNRIRFKCRCRGAGY